MSKDEELLIALLDGSTHANAIMPWGLGPIRLPEQLADRRDLVRAHLNGSAAQVEYSPRDKPPQIIEVRPLVLGVYSPGADGLCRSVAFDFDAAKGHGPNGLLDPAHAVRCLAERADTLGLSPGLLTVRSRGAVGRHVWLVPPGPIPLRDAVVAAAFLAAASRRIADWDAKEGEEVRHAFLRADGYLASPGQAGAFELIPPSSERPQTGWALTLPAAGAFVPIGGGAIVDPFSDEPISLSAVPRCRAESWSKFFRAAEIEVAGRLARKSTVRLKGAGQRTHPLTQALLLGQTPKGSRNKSVYAAACNLLGCGIPPEDVEKQVFQGGLATGLPEREVRAAIRSALRTKGVRS